MESILFDSRTAWHSSWYVLGLYRKRGYALDKWIYPFFEGRLLADIKNRAMRDFVEHISSLSAATIRDYTCIVRSVVASAIDDNGEPMEQAEDGTP